MSIIGPVFDWELYRLGSPRRLLISRTAFALLTLVLLTVMHSAIDWSANFDGIPSAARFAAAFLRIFTFAQWTAVFVIVPGYVATAIAIEKERRTLDELLVTDLRPLEIVAGKWAARWFILASIAIAAIPVLIFATFFGGIEAKRVLLASLALMATIASTTTIALLASVEAKHVRSAIWSAHFWLLVWLIGPILIASPYLGALFITGQLFEWNALWIGELICLLNPYFMWLLCMNDMATLGYLVERTAYYVAIHGGGSLLGIALAARRLRRVRSEEWMRGLARPAATVPTMIRKSFAVGDRPMAWKEWNFGHRLSRIESLLATFGMIAITYAGFAIALFSPAPSLSETANVVVSGLSALAAGVFLLLIAVQLASSIGVEKERLCWESLLATPLPGYAILVGKASAVVKTLRWLPVVLAPLWLVGWLASGISLLAIPLFVLVVAIHALFLTGIAIRQSLLCRSTLGAIACTMAVCLPLYGGVPLLNELSATAIGGYRLENLASALNPWTSLLAANILPVDFWHELLDLISFWPIAFLLVLALVGGFLFSRSISRFDVDAGRQC